MTTSTLTRIAPTQVALEFPITGQELAAAEERAFRKLAKDVRLPGFRKGKVPRKLFEQTYGAGVIAREAVDDVVPHVYAKAIEEHDLHPVDRPSLEVMEEADGRPSRVKAIVEVRPQIDLHDYTGVPVSRPPISVSDEDVERSLAALAKERATLVPVQRAARLGDVVTMDYEGKIGGEPFEGGSGSGQVTELAEGRFIPGFAAGIAGMSAGESKTIELRFPDDYAETAVAAKAATFDVTLHDIKEYDVPPLDDDLAKAISNHATLDELRADLRRRLEAMATMRSRQVMGNAVMGQVLRAHDFPLPNALVENEIDRLLDEAAAGGVGERAGDAEARESRRAEAEARVKAGLLIEAIAKAENITATPGDVAAELQVLARRYGQPVGKIRSALGNNLLSLIDGIVRTKTLEFLVDNAAIAANEETLSSAS